MAKRRKTTKKRRRTNPTRRRRNPSRARRASSAFKSSFFGLDFKKAFGDMPYIQAGMFASKWAAKRLDPAATEDDPTTWNWSSYAKGALGAVAAGMLANAFRRGKGNLVLQGGLNLMVFKAIENELIPTSGFWHDQLGAEADYVPEEYLMTGTDDDPYAYDLDGNMYPADDRHRFPEYSGYGADALEPVSALGNMGAEALEPVTALGNMGADPFAQAYHQ